MGTGASRGKRVAPVCDVNVTKPGIGVAPGRRDRNPVKRHKIQTVRKAPVRAQPDSQGRDSDSENKEDRERAAGKKTLIRSKTCGLCLFSQEDTEDEVSSPEEPRVPHGASKDKRDTRTPHTPGVFIQHHPSTLKCLASGNLLESSSKKQPALNSCSSLTTPVTLYDGSEEELMDTIEREFS